MENEMKPTPTIEEQIKTVIADTMTAFHDENKKMITETIKIVVNGKIDSFREDQKKVNDSQNKALDEIKKSVENVVSLYDGSGRFFRAIKVIAIWISAVGGAGVVVWSFVQLVLKNLVSR